MGHYEQAGSLTYLAIANILFSGSWISADEQTWSFRIARFIHGDAQSLQHLSMNFDQVAPWEKFVAIDSQGDGRLLEKFSWRVDEKGQYEITCTVGPKPSRQDPNRSGMDIPFDFEDGDLKMENGDFVLITGKDAALQSLQLLLGSPPGSWLETPHIYSHLYRYCRQYCENPDILEPLIKTEIIRLMSVTYQAGDENPAPELSFINRVIAVGVQGIDLDKRLIRLSLELEFGNYEHWKGDLSIYTP